MCLLVATSTRFFTLCLLVATSSRFFTEMSCCFPGLLQSNCLKQTLQFVMINTILPDILQRLCGQIFRNPFPLNVLKKYTILRQAHRHKKLDKLTETFSRRFFSFSKCYLMVNYREIIPQKQFHINSFTQRIESEAY